MLSPVPLALLGDHPRLPLINIPHIHARDVYLQYVEKTAIFHRTGRNLCESHVEGRIPANSASLRTHAVAAACRPVKEAAATVDARLHARLGSRLLVRRVPDCGLSLLQVLLHLDRRRVSLGALRLASF